MESGLITPTALIGSGATKGVTSQAYAAARENSLWLPLERILKQQVGGPGESPVEAGLRDYILLITILVAFLEAAVQQLRPQPPQVVMGFAGIHSPRSKPDEHT
jgi:hypothetical protein